jgi:NhaA family Na+:H+ antiporter
MSLFIGLLAFTTDEFHDATKIGVLGGSVLSALVGWSLLRITPQAK